MKLKINLNNIATLCTFFYGFNYCCDIWFTTDKSSQLFKKKNNNRMHVIEFSTNIKVVMRIHIIHMVFV